MDSFVQSHKRILWVFLDRSLNSRNSISNAYPNGFLISSTILVVAVEDERKRLLRKFTSFYHSGQMLFYRFRARPSCIVANLNALIKTPKKLISQTKKYEPEFDPTSPKYVLHPKIRPIRGSCLILDLFHKLFSVVVRKYVFQRYGFCRSRWKLLNQTMSFSRSSDS